MLNNDNGNPYLIPDLNVSLFGMMFAVVYGRNPLFKDISFFFPSFAKSSQEYEFRFEQHY